ncbi:MAG: DUF5024 domain-containing protein [Muribaculaceae bacterium]|nr:DUF5024 domain-containing protein [Muribaculaceae bacterium]MDE6682735.1 DUF5024 domain-containing protein [Muribaculaceae bacterium]
MKRYIIIIVCLCISILAMAKPPQLNVEKLFDGSYNSDKSVQIHISKNKDKYYRGFTVNNNAALVKKVTQLFKKDTDRAETSQDIIKDGGPSYSYMVIKNNNHDINIGIQYYSNSSCYLFINGSSEAFK